MRKQETHAEELTLRPDDGTPLFLEIWSNGRHAVIDVQGGPGIVISNPDAMAEAGEMLRTMATWMRAQQNAVKQPA